MRLRLPLVLVSGFGVALLLQYFVPHPAGQALYTRTLEWMQVIFAAGLILGGAGFVRSHLKRAATNRADRPYSLLALVALCVMLVAGAVDIGRDSAFLWLFDNLQAPMQQTVFSLLAFFVASAAFRGFRLRSVESGLLLAVALVVMIGRIPVGELISPALPQAAAWLVDVPAVAAKRGILIGVGLGSVAVALRVMLGVERAWLGGSK
jgi:hypothetical protein